MPFLSLSSGLALILLSLLPDIKRLCPSAYRAKQLPLLCPRSFLLHQYAPQARLGELELVAAQVVLQVEGCLKGQ